MTTHCGCNRGDCATQQRTNARPCCATCAHVIEQNPQARGGTSVKCRWNGTERVTNEHTPGCNTPGCAGCKTCTHRHCNMPRCNRHLTTNEPHTCTTCISKVRTNLHRIQTLTTWAPTVAASARRLDAPEVDLAGATADPTTYNYRHRWAIGGALCRCEPNHCPDNLDTPHGPLCKNATRTDSKACDHHVCRRLTYRPTCPELAAWLETTTSDDEHHPHWVLATWDALVANHLEHTRTNQASVTSAVAYITRNLTELARDPGFPFDELATEIKTCVAHMETILAIAPHTQKGAPCPVCHQAGRKAKPLERQYLPAPEGKAVDARDLWVCRAPECHQTWTVDEYDKYIQREHAKRADRLTASALAREYRVTEGTVHNWASRNPVRRHGRDSAGRVLYDVADILKLRDRQETPAC